MEEGDLTGCVEIPESESHWLFKVPVPLERSTAYTLDVEPTDQPPFSTEPDELPRAPLFRVAFSTSRFRSAAELGEVMRAARVQHRVLKKAIGRSPTPPARTSWRTPWSTPGWRPARPRASRR